MITEKPGLMDEVRSRFAHVDTCPITGPRIFFENAGGALTLKSVVETSATYAAIPDNQGRDNPASKALMDTIARAKADMRTFFNVAGGQLFVGESGTEVLFRLIRNAVNAAPEGGKLLGSTLEHPASRSAMGYWAEKTGREHILVAHDDASGSVTVEAYKTALSPDLRVATILHTSPVTGMSVDVPAIAAAIRAAAPDCLIIVDGIQHASHGHIDIDSYGTESRDYLLDAGHIPDEMVEVYEGVSDEVLDGVEHAFDRAGHVGIIRLHGDFHPGNVLVAGDQFHIVDLDDARSGPAVQDLWMFLSGDREEQTPQLAALLSGYQEFRRFDARELHLVEALRSLRILHYAAWLGRRWDDPAFQKAFPWFASRRYWDEHVLALREQLALLQEPPLVWQDY